MFYALGHFTKFLIPGSVRIEVNSTSSHLLESPMEVCGFLRPDGLVVLVVLNRVGREGSYDVVLKDGSVLKMDVPMHSFQTILFEME